MSERNNLLIPGSIVIAGVVIALAVLYVGGAGRGAVSPPDQAANSSGTVPSAGDLTDNDPAIGSPDAPVVMIEFSDFECPFCGQFFRTTLPRIEEEYIKTGKVRFIYRDFPISTIHSNAEKAAEAAECANEQGKFWQYHDVIFQRQSELSLENYKRWAVELGLNTSQFNACLDGGKYDEEVAKDFRDGQVAGVSGTPTFFINGQRVVGALPFEQFKAILDAELAAK